MRIEFRRTFSQFVDNYIASYFGTPGQTFIRLTGGPLLIVSGAFLIIYTRTADIWSSLIFIINLTAVILILYGLFYLFRPVLNIFLVWLRRDQFLGPADAVMALELLDEKLRVHEGADPFDLPLDKILAVQRRAKSAWIITKSDNLVYFPLEDLLSGDADAFMDALDAAIAPDEEE
jgi:hypothetical protein